MSARKQPAHRYSGRAVWTMTSLAWAGVMCLVVYSAVMAVFPLVSGVLTGPLMIGWSFGFPVMAGIAVTGRAAWLAWTRLRFEMIAGIVGLLLLLAFPYVLVPVIIGVLGS